MPYPTHATATLGQMTDAFYYSVKCRCGHDARIDLVALQARLGDDFKVEDLRKMLRCVKCGERGRGVSCYLTPEQQVAALKFGPYPR